MTGTKKLSGVNYNTGGTATYQVTVSNAYKDVYSNSNITFSASSCSVPAQAFPSIGGGENSGKSITISAISFLGVTML